MIKLIMDMHNANRNRYDIYSDLIVFYGISTLVGY